MMYGDMMYCNSCGRTFKDTWRMHDTRTEKVETNCPFCLSNYTTNASKFIEEFESMNNYSIKDKCFSKQSLITLYRNLYKKLKTKNMIFKAKNREILIFEDIFYPRRVIDYVRNKSS